MRAILMFHMTSMESPAQVDGLLTESQQFCNFALIDRPFWKGNQRIKPTKSEQFRIRFRLKSIVSVWAQVRKIGQQSSSERRSPSLILVKASIHRYSV